MTAPITPDAVRKISSDYILEKFCQQSELKDDQLIGMPRFLDEKGEIDLIRVLFNNSNNLLRMYGSPEEHMKNLRISRNFTMSYKYFGTKPTVAFYTNPLMYKSLKNDFFMAKPDFFVILENIAVKGHPDMQYGVYSAFLALFIKMQVEKVNKTLEFVRIDNAKVEMIAREFKIGMDCCNDDSPRFPEYLPIKISSGSIPQFYDKIMEFFPGVSEEDDGSVTILYILKFMYSNRGDDLRIGCFNHLLFVFETLVNCLNDIIKKHSELFLPTDITTNPSPPIVVRLFDDGEPKFVMKSEFLRAIDPNSNYMERVDYGYETIQMKEVLEKYKDNIDRIEFIRTPILRTKHKPVPIRLVESEEFCVLAVDALFELLREIIFGIKLFQYVEEWPLSIFQQIHSVFDSNLNNQYFINLRVFNDLKKSINAAYSSSLSPPPKDVRNAKKDGFTVQNLKNELKHLGLEKHFPEISDHAEIAHTEVMELKKERFLRTCDLYDAVEICQLRCIFNRVPELRIFLHHQKSCWRVLGLRCDYCTGAEPFYENGRCEISIFAEAPKDNSIDTWLTGGRPVYKPIPERFKTVSKSEDPVLKLKTEKFDIEATNSHENSIADVNKEYKESEAKIEILRKKLMEKEEEIVNFKRDALIHEKTVKGFKELKAKIAVFEAREKEMIEERERDALAHEKTVKGFKELKEKIVEYKAREKEMMEERERNELTHSKTVLENEHLMRENASFRSQLKDSIERIKSEIDTRDKEIEKLGKKIANYEKKQMNEHSIRAEIEKENENLKKEIEEEMQKNAITVEELSNLKMRLETSEAQMSEARSQYEITIEQLEKENQELKGSNELYCNNFNSINETIHRERQTFGAVRQQLVERISELERELISRNQPGNIGITDWIAEKRVMQEEIAEKTRQIAQVIESNVVLRTENEMNSRMVQNLLDRLSGISISSGVAPTPPPSGPSTSSWNHQNPTRDSELEDETETKDDQMSSMSTVPSLLTKALRWMTLGVEYDWNTKQYPPNGRAVPEELYQLGNLINISLKLGDMRPDATILNYYR
ncbi:hypothetical protein CRE_22527 [Caenorhabditis remanei]|uniref:DUF7809 domain-containing protein n=1 Tax=Caenorhabditis remanei TaxID=31234 RepID=E3MU73_CAERE|nr:hypothetical protein CRE_22527 [Caenorhabditis remanei]